ncbi:hypothetical protein PanWU01x14_167440 [Parasponia andersonii]|uniref:Uncharacterized protein n=1 Tax=Parasponia andersonii TaxID=3476 RepID=A0A2P5CBD0_PARAD|nr:hypothetical protein PanWU01x14_167440 [Parasponia andersonii]
MEPQLTWSPPWLESCSVYVDASTHENHRIPSNGNSGGTSAYQGTGNAEMSDTESDKSDDFEGGAKTDYTKWNSALHKLGLHKSPIALERHDIVGGSFSH